MKALSLMILMALVPAISNAGETRIQNVQCLTAAFDGQVIFEGMYAVAEQEPFGLLKVRKVIGVAEGKCQLDKEIVFPQCAGVMQQSYLGAQPCEL